MLLHQNLQHLRNLLAGLMALKPYPRFIRIPYRIHIYGQEHFIRRR